MVQIRRYFAIMFGDITHSPNWFGKICLMALINFIPIFGPIAVAGYIYGWARDISWGIHQPMPEHILGNSDGRQYSRGFFAWVLDIVWTLPVTIIAFIGNWSFYRDLLFGTDLTRDMALQNYLTYSNMPLTLLEYALELVIFFFLCAGLMRMSIYGRLSPGFQIGRIWKMIRHDSEGLWRILGLRIVIALICGMVVGIVTTILLILLLLPIYMSPMYLTNGSVSMSDLGAIIQSLGPGMIVAIVCFIALFAYAISIVQAFLATFTARALGYWAMNFDVPHWRGQDDPLPFETALNSPANNNPPMFNPPQQ